MTKKNKSTVEYKTKQELAPEKKQVVVDRELKKLFEKHGDVTGDLVLNTARDPRHPLHLFFDWDDTIAGEKWRQAQALQLIIASKIIPILKQGPRLPKMVSPHTPSVRGYVSAFRNGGFKARKVALSEAETRGAFIEKRLSVLRFWCDSVVDLEELQPIRNKILRELAAWDRAVQVQAAE